MMTRPQMTVAALRAEAREWETRDLRQFLAQLGWRPGKPGQRNPPHLDTTANNLRMHRGADELSVGRDGQRYLFIDLATKRGGSILSYPVAFEGRRPGADACNFIREALGGHASSSSAPIASVVAVPEAPATSLDARAREIDSEFRAMALLSARSAAYFAQRGIDPQVALANAYLIREQHHGSFVNPVFGYAWNGVTHYETRWLSADGKSHKLGPKAGQKHGLWLSHRPDAAAGFRTIVIGENPVDALAYTHLLRPDRAILAAFGGSLTDGPNGPQMRAIVELCERLCDAAVVLAVDTDATGHEYVHEITARVQRAVAHQPYPCPGVKDWTDVARQEMDARQEQPA